MHVLILTIGTRGDVQPYVALGLGLRAAGYAVTVVTSPSFAGFVAERGLGFAPLQIDYLALLDTVEARSAVGGSWRNVRQMLAPGYHIAEKLGIPGFLALPVPAYSPTATFPSPLLPLGRSLDGPLNRLTYTLLPRLATLPFAGLVNTWRREALGLPPRRALASDLTRAGRPVPRLYPVSPAVVPPPPDWDASSVLTGFWFLDRPAAWQPPAAPPHPPPHRRPGHRPPRLSPAAAG